MKLVGWVFERWWLWEKNMKTKGETQFVPLFATLKQTCAIYYNKRISVTLDWSPQKAWHLIKFILIWRSTHHKKVFYLGGHSIQGGDWQSGWWRSRPCRQAVAGAVVWRAMKQECVWILHMSAKTSHLGWKHELQNYMGSEKPCGHIFFYNSKQIEIFEVSFELGKK